MLLSKRHHIAGAQSYSLRVSIVSIYLLSSKTVFRIAYNPAISNSAVVDLFIHSGRKFRYKNPVLPVSKEIERILGAPYQGQRELACESS